MDRLVTFSNVWSRVTVLRQDLETAEHPAGKINTANKTFQVNSGKSHYRASASCWLETGFEEIEGQCQVAGPRSRS